MKDFSRAFIQKTHPAETRPVRPSCAGGGIGASKRAMSAGASDENVIAMGGIERPSNEVSFSARFSTFERFFIRLLFPISVCCVQTGVIDFRDTSLIFLENY